MPWDRNSAAMPPQRRFQVALDVVGQCLQRRHVDDLHGIGQRAADGLAHQAVDGCEEGGQCLAGSGGRRDQGVAPGLDRGPRRTLRGRRSRESGG